MSVACTDAPHADHSSEAYRGDFAAAGFEYDDRMLDAAALKKVLCDPTRGTMLTEEECTAMFADFASHGLNFADGGKVSIDRLRAHPCYQADQGSSLLKGRDSEDEG